MNLPERGALFSSKLFLLIPAGILCVYFACNPFDFHSDDLGHWLAAVEWKSLFENWPFGTAFWAVLNSPRPHPSFHPLLGTLFLSVFGSVEAATRAIDLFFATVATTSCYFLLKKDTLKESEAILGALAVCTYPYLLGIGRSFMAELPFCAFSLAALACLRRSRFKAFGLAYLAALLIRPPEGLVLLPTLLLFFAAAKGSFRGCLERKFLGALAFALSMATIAYSFRAKQFLSWIRFTFYTGAERSIVASDIHFGLENLQFVVKSIYVAFGPLGLLLLATTAFLLWRDRKNGRWRLYCFLGIFASLFVFLAALSTFQNFSARGMFGRFTLALVLCLFLLCSMNLLRAGAPKFGKTLLALFFAVNCIFSLIAASGPGSRSRLELGLFTSHLYWAFHYRYFPEDSWSIAHELTNILPRDAKSYVLLVGVDPNLIGPLENTKLRLIGWGDVQMGRDFPATYLSQIFRIELRSGKAALKKFHVDAVIFQRGTGQPTAPAFPSREVFEALTDGRAAQLGLKFEKRIAWSMGDGFREVEVYRAE